ncbi:MAG: M56 family metallopeptidase [Oscillatoria sp. PMC 1068.18]|nr:M56 family metallopeptidase [Oscillatoria sp. PMC 1076.18]MEC4988931.1 M56 family metallopeptidase [Oscillatoria sp. PMC 1068.18]
MHLVIILTTTAIAWGLRLFWDQSGESWTTRWQRSLFLFLLPPLLLLMTAAAVLFMGPSGKMLGLHAGWISYLVAIAFLGWAIFCLLKRLHQMWSSCQEIRAYLQLEINGKIAHILDTNFPYSAQIGFWHSDLVVSKGLLQTLDKAHLEAVLAHEKAHSYYRDTFWFFWLGWLRYCTSWLPDTEALWQELLLLREMRADRHAAAQVDPLLLAESLLEVAQAPLKFNDSFSVAFSCATPANRLTERINALLTTSESPTQPKFWTWSWMLFALIPLFTVPFHQ